MNCDETKDKIRSATRKLLINCDDVEKVTTRAIASEADVNPAMVNYYFGTKDELLRSEIDHIISDVTVKGGYLCTGTGNPRKVIYDFLQEMCEKEITFDKYTKAYIPDMMLKDKIEIPLYLVDLLKEYFGDKKTEYECRVISYQMVSFLQLIFYRSSDFKEYSGIDLYDMNQRRLFITKQLDLFMGDVL